MRIYNTLTGRLERFLPSDGSTVRMYTCGPTAYGRPHIGNFRTFVCLDALRRTLRHVLGYGVCQAMNITDVDDWTVAGARQAGMDVRPFTELHIAAFEEDARTLALEAVEHAPRASAPANLDAAAALVDTLIANGHAYEIGASVYFDVRSMAGYGRLAGLDTDRIERRSRVEWDNYLAEHAADFALWRGPKTGEPQWEAGSRRGRPGWHIECSAMALRLLGAPVDIHAGGVDLLFPHHANTAAQTEAATGRPFARFLVHVHHLLIDGRKMSKSSGNTRTVPELLERGCSPAALRYLLLAGHYREPLNFTWQRLAAAEQAVADIDRARSGLESVEEPGEHPRLIGKIHGAMSAFERALRDDLDTPSALAAIGGLAAEVRDALARGGIGAADAAAARRAFAWFDRVLAVFPRTGADDTAVRHPSRVLRSPAFRQRSLRHARS